MRLQGRVAVVTGAASGIGLAIANAFAREGANVVIGDLDEHRGREVVREVEARGGKGLFVKADVSKRADCKNLIERAVSNFQGLDVVVNNAGLQHVSPVTNFDEDRWDYLINVMLTGTFLCSKYALPYLIKSGRGRIINMSSIHGLVASKFKSAYVAAKHGVVGFTKVLALEMADYNVTVNAICPGYVRTPLVENQLDGQARAYGIPRDQVIEKVILADAPTKRLLEPEEIADLAVYLASDSARGVTGAAIPIDGGWTAR